MKDAYDFSAAGLAKKALKPFQQAYNQQAPIDDYSSLQQDYGALGAPVAAATQQVARMGAAANKAALGLAGQAGGVVDQGLGYLFGNNYKNTLGSTYINPAQAAALNNTTPAKNSNPQIPAEQQSESIVEQKSNKTVMPLGAQPVNNAFIQATPENVPARIGNNAQVEFTNPDGTGSGSIDFGNPEKNALMVKKIQQGRGTLNVGNGFFNAQNYADSTRANTVAKVGEAFRAGKIDSAEATRLMAEAKQGSEPEQFFDPEQAALQQENQQFSQTLQQQNQQFQDSQVLEREKLAALQGNQTPNKYALDPLGQAYPTQGKAGDRFFQQQQERALKNNKAQQVVNALDGTFFLDAKSKKQLKAARAWLESNGQG